MPRRHEILLLVSVATVLLAVGPGRCAPAPVLFSEDFAAPEIAMDGDPKVWKVADGALVGQGGAEWNYSLIKQDIPADSAIEAEVTIPQKGPAGALGQGTGDWFRYRMQRDCPGSEACLILRSFGSSLTESWWYRVELSARYGEIALHKGNGGYVQVVPAEVRAGAKHRLKAEARQNRIRAWLDGELLIDFQDDFAPIEGEGGRWGVGVFGTQALFDNLTVGAPEETTLAVLPRPRRYMRIRTWREGQWIFCDNEPIAWLDPEGKHTSWPSLAEMKLLPGYQPMLMAKITWGHCMPNNEFADKVEIVKAEGEEVVVRTTGHTLFVKSTGVQEMAVSYDRVRKCFSYRFDSTATVAADTPRRAPVEYNVLFPYSTSPNAWGQFHFDPLTEGVAPGPPLPPTIARTDGGWYLDWQFLPGPGFMYRLPIRVDWDSSPEPRATRVERYVQFQPKPGDIYARGLHPVINPAVEWLGPERSTGQASFAVCAFSHETHLSDCPVKWETEEERTMHRTYRLIGLYPAEMARIFRASRLPAIPEMYRLKVQHRPGINDFGPGQLNPVGSPQVGNTWKGFYDVDLACGKGDNSSLLLQPIPKPAAYGGGVQMPYATAWLLKPTGNWDDWGYVPAPKYLVIADVKTEGLTGKGIYFTLQREGEKVTHYPGLTGTNDWTTAGFVTDLFAQPGGNQAYMTVGLEGEGKAWIDNLEVRPLQEGEQPPAGVSPEPHGDG